VGRRHGNNMDQFIVPTLMRAGSYFVSLTMISWPSSPSTPVSDRRTLVTFRQTERHRPDSFVAYWTRLNKGG
jgi:hypothetical protein